jgi:hypothetical protein
MPSSKKKIISILGWAIVILIPLAILLVATELTLRLLLPEINVLTRIIEPTSDSRNFILKANTKIHYQGLYEKHKPVTWKINQQGLRSDRIEKNTSNKFRVLTYGDSETYGWSVDIQNSWQRRMEKIDPNIEVLNFGIPGYNVENVADHMQHTITEYHPSMLIYFFNKNDFYPAFKFNPVLSRSYTYLVFRMGLYMLSKDKRKAWRKSLQGEEFLQAQIKRMIGFSNQYKVPLYILVMHWEYVNPIQQITKPQNNNLKIIDIEEVVEKFPKIDAHLTEPAHLELAKYLCNQISQNKPAKCTPATYKNSTQ